jgi:hypothetical protein
MNKLTESAAALGLVTALSACSNSLPGTAYVYDDAHYSEDNHHRDAVCDSADSNDSGSVDTGHYYDAVTEVLDSHTHSDATPTCVDDLPEDFWQAILHTEDTMYRTFPRAATNQSSLFSFGAEYSVRPTDLLRPIDIDYSEGTVAVTAIAPSEDKVSVCTARYNNDTEQYAGHNCFTYTLNGDNYQSDTTPVNAWQITRDAIQGAPERRTYDLALNYDGHGVVTGCDTRFNQASQPEAGYLIEDVCPEVCIQATRDLMSRHTSFLEQHPDL